MASVLTFNPGALFIVRVWKHSIENPGFEWTNTYEMKARGSGTLSTLEDFAAKAVAFEVGLHTPAIEFSRVTISTWERDTHPYDPEAFYDKPIASGTLGARLTTGEAMPLRVCWAAQRAAQTGRVGKLYYRGCLVESDVQGSGQSYSFSDPADMATLLSNSATTSQFSNYYSVGLGALELSMIGLPKNIGTPQVRPVLEIRSKGVVDVQMNHRWFNRAAP